MRPDLVLERRDLLGRGVVHGDDEDVPDMLEAVQPTQVVRGVRPEDGERIVARRPRRSSRKRMPLRPMASGPCDRAADHDEADALVADEPGEQPRMAGRDVLEGHALRGPR